MKVADYLVDTLANHGVTDVFGIPGGVVLELLYAFDRDNRITPHLSYHEQGAAFEACGYAQCKHRLGVAYATRGPGFTNLITGIADAYADSIPVLFITAHAHGRSCYPLRFENEQEMDTVSMVRRITKYAKAVDKLEEVGEAIQTACEQAISGRKGPVFLDFSSRLWGQEMAMYAGAKEKLERINQRTTADEIVDAFSQATRPIILVGDGIRQANAAGAFEAFVRDMKLPVLSSRCGQDVGAVSKYYYGYIGSHGIRYSNFILEKADFVLVLGNRLGFPLKSESFVKVLGNKRIIRIDIDEGELALDIPHVESYKCDIQDLLDALRDAETLRRDYSKWIETCEILRNELCDEDQNAVIRTLTKIISALESDVTICCDVGNNEFWVSRAYVEAKSRNRILYSKSFGALGCGVPKAIGASLSTQKPVLCIVGDQGFQVNAQELQMIAKEKLPVCVLVINNHSSGMIRSRQKAKYQSRFIHTTLNGGYSVPDIHGLARAHGIAVSDKAIVFPSVVDMEVDEAVDLEPSLPIGNDCQDMYPYVDRKRYERLQSL